MSEPDLHALTGAYAADALAAAEREAFEAHLATCAECRQEVAELAATTARLAVAVAQPPPPAMRDRVLAAAAGTRQVSPLDDVPDLTARRDRRSWLRTPVAAAAAVLLVVATGLGGLAVREHRKAEDARQLADQIAAVATDPDHFERSAPITGGGTGTVLMAGDKAVFRATALPSLPDDRAYQLWRLSGQQSTSAGVLGRGGDVTVLVTDMGPGDSIGLTVEPAGGSDHPTTDPVLLVSAA